MSACDVLVIDDDPDIREVTRLILESACYEVATAADGAEALRWLRTEAAPKVILLDLMMPGMNGWELLGALARDPALADIPVVVMTGAAPDAASLGAARLLAKPLEVATLLAEVRRHCQPA